MDQQNIALKFILFMLVAFAVFLGVAFAAAKVAGNLFPLIFIFLSLGTIVFVVWMGEKYFGAKNVKVSGWTLAKRQMDDVMQNQGELPKVKKKEEEEE